MARFIRQLCVLLWKNGLCRLRQPVLTLSEIIWPCLLFLILVGVRVQHQPHQQENCYLEPRTLPSGGLFSFVQSLLCDVGSECHSTAVTGAGNNSPKSRSSLGFTDESGTDLLALIQELGKDINETMDKASSLQNQLDDLFGESDQGGEIGLLTVDLNQLEQLIYKIERIHNETYTWNILFKLPKLLETLKNEDFLSKGTSVMADTVMDLKRLLESLKDLSNSTNESLYLVLDTSFNLTISALNILHNVSTRGMEQKLTLQDVLLDREASESTLKLSFNMDPVMTKQLLKASIPLFKFSILLKQQEFQKYLCTEFVQLPCTAWKNVSNYLFYDIDKIRVVKQVFNLWYSSGLPEYLLTTFDQMSAALTNLSTNEQDFETASSAQQVLYLLRDVIHVTVLLQSNTSSEEAHQVAMATPVARSPLTLTNHPRQPLAGACLTGPGDPKITYLGSEAPSIFTALGLLQYQQWPPLPVALLGPLSYWPSDWLAIRIEFSQGFNRGSRSLKYLEKLQENLQIKQVLMIDKLFRNVIIQTMDSVRGLVQLPASYMIMAPTPRFGIGSLHDQSRSTWVSLYRTSEEDKDDQQHHWIQQHQKQRQQQQQHHQQQQKDQQQVTAQTWLCQRYLQGFTVSGTQCIRQVIDGFFARVANYANFAFENASQNEQVLSCFAALVGFLQVQGINNCIHGAIKASIDHLGCSSILTAPLRSLRNESQEQYDECHITNRCAIIQAIGMLKIRFRRLDRSGLDLKEDQDTERKNSSEESKEAEDKEGRRKQKRFYMQQLYGFSRVRKPLLKAYMHSYYCCVSQSMQLTTLCMKQDIIAKASDSMRSYLRLTPPISLQSCTEHLECLTEHRTFSAAAAQEVAGWLTAPGSHASDLQMEIRKHRSSATGQNNGVGRLSLPVSHLGTPKGVLKARELQLATVKLAWDSHRGPDALDFLKKVSSALGVNIVNRIMLDVDILMTEMKMILTQNVTVTCNDMVLKIKDVLNLPEEPFVNEVLTVIIYGHQLPSDPWNVTEHFPSMKSWVESLRLLQSVIEGQQDIQVTFLEEHRGWREIMTAFDTNNNFYKEFFRNLIDNMTVSSELWKGFQFSTFQEHLLWNLAFDIFDALGSGLVSSDFWPGIEKYIRGMCWLIENSNQPSAGNGSFSGSNCIKGEINWRNLFNETLIFGQNAGSDSDTLGKRFLKATLKLLNLNNIIKLSADDVQIISLSFGNFSKEDYFFKNVQRLQIVAKVILENIPLWMNKYISATDETSSIRHALLELSQVNSINSLIDRIKFLINQWSKGQSPQFMKTVNILLSVLQKELPNIMIISPFQNTIDRFNVMWSNLQPLLIYNSTETLTKSLHFFWNFTSTVWIGSTKANIDYPDVVKMFLHYLNNLGFLSQEQLSSTVDAINGLNNASIIASSSQSLSQLQGVELQLFKLLETIAVENKTEHLEMFYNLILAVSQLSNVTELSSLVAAVNNISEDISTLFEQFSSNDIGEALETISNIVVVFHNMSKEDFAENLLDLYLYLQSQIQALTEITGPELQQINETIARLTEAFHNNTNNISCLMLQALQSSSVPISDTWLRKYCSIHNTRRKIRSAETGSISQSSQNLYRSLVEQMINNLMYTNREMALSSLSCTADLLLSWTQIIKMVAVQLDLDFQVVNFFQIALTDMSQELNQTSLCTEHLIINNSTAALKVILQNISSTNGFNLQNLYQSRINRFIILQHVVSTFPISMDNKRLQQLVEIMENVLSLFQGSNLDTLNSISKFLDALRPMWSLYDPQQEKLYSILHKLATLNSNADLESIKVVFREILLFYNNSFSTGYLDHSVQYLKEVLNLMAAYENSGGQFPYKTLMVLVKQLIYSENPNTGEKEWAKLLQWLNVLTHTNLSDPSLSFLSDITTVPIFTMNISEIDIMRKTEDAIFKVQNLTEQFNGLNASDAYYYDVIALLEVIFPDSCPYKNKSIQILRMSIELAYNVFNDENMSYDLTEQLMKQVQSLVNGTATTEELFGYLSKMISGSVNISQWYSVDSTELLTQQLQTLSVILTADQNIQQFSLLLRKLILLMDQSAFLNLRPEKISNMLFGTLDIILNFNERTRYNLAEAISMLLSKTADASCLSSSKCSEQDMNIQNIRLIQLFHQTVQFTEELDEVLKPRCKSNLTMIQANESIYLLIDYINNTTFNNNSVVEKQLATFINGLERFPLSEIACAADVMNFTGNFLMTIQQIVDNGRISDTEQLLQFAQSASRVLHGVSEILKVRNDTTAAAHTFILLKNESSYLAKVFNSTNYTFVKKVLRMTDDLIGHFTVKTSPSPGTFFQQLLLCLDSFSKLLELVEMPQEITEELKGFGNVLQFFHPYVNKSHTQDLENDSVLNITLFVLQHLNSVNEIHSQLQLLKTDLQNLLNTTVHMGSSNKQAVYRLNELTAFVGNVTLAHNTGRNNGTLQDPLRLDVIIQTVQLVREYVLFLNKVSLPPVSTIDGAEMFIQLIRNSLTRINYTEPAKLFAVPWTSLFNDKVVHRMLSLLLGGFVQQFSSVPQDQINLTENITYIIYNLTTTLSTRDINAINDHLEQMNKLTRFFKNVNATGDLDTILNLLTKAARILKHVSDVQNMTEILHAIKVVSLEIGNEHFPQALAIIPGGITLIQNLVTMNVSEAMQAVYLFGQAKGLLFSQGNQTELNEKIIRLMQIVSSMANSSKISQCLPVAVCKLLSEETPSDDDDGLFLKACNFKVNQSLSTAFALAADVKQLIAGAVQGTAKVECSGSTVFRKIIQQTGCVLQQFEELNTFLLRISQIYGLECPVLIKLQEIWNNFSYVIVSSNEDDLSCPVVQLRQGSDKLLGLISNLTLTNTTSTEQVINFLSDISDIVLLMSGNTSDLMQNTLKIVTSYFKSVPKNVLTPSDSKNHFSTLISNVQLLLSISGFKGDPLYSVLNDLQAALNMNVTDLLETLSTDINKILSDPMRNPKMKDLLPAVEKVISFLRNITTGGFVEVNVVQFNEALNDVEEILETMQLISNFTDENYHELLIIISNLLKNQKYSEVANTILANIVKSASLMSNISQLLLDQMGSAASVLDVYQTLLTDMTATISNENFNQSSYILQLLSEFVLEVYSRWDLSPEFQRALINKVKQVAAELSELLPVSSGPTINYVHFISKIFLEFLEISTNKGDNLTEIRNVPLKLMKELEEFLGVMQVSSSIRKAVADASNYAELLLKQAEEFKGAINYTIITEICQFDWFNNITMPPVNTLHFQSKMMNLLSEKRYFINDIMCIQKDCRQNFAGHLLHALTELCNLTTEVKQISEETFYFSGQGDCRSYVNSYIQVQTASSQMDQAVESAVKNYHCNCELTSLLPEQLYERFKFAAATFSPNSSLVTTLENIGTFQGLPLEDCVQNITTLKMQLQQIGGISPETMDVLLKANITFSKLVLGLLAMLDGCDEASLALMLSISDNINISSVTAELCYLTPLQYYRLILTISHNMDLRCILYKAFLPVMIHPQANQVMQNILDVFSGLSSFTFKSLQVLDLIPKLLQSVKDLNLPSLFEINENVQERSGRTSASVSFQSLSKAICATKSSSIFNSGMMFSELPQISELTEEDFIKYNIPKNATPYCLSLYQDILKAANGPLLWTFLKPLLLGEILYAPSTVEIQRLMEKANSTFSVVEELKTYSEVWLKTSDFMQFQGTPMLSQLQGALQNNFVRSFIQSQLDININELLEKLQQYEQTINLTMNDPVVEQITLLSQMMVNISSCILLDRFKHLESKEELEQKVEELMSKNVFLASVLFDIDASNTSRKTRSLSSPLPSQVSYTIRTNILHSMPTNQLANPKWESQPQKLPTDSFHYNRVFIPLQDMIERAIIELQVGQDVPNPAIQMQAMPYPCHTSDQFLNNTGFFFPLLMMLAWLISVASMVRKLVFEKELRLEEYTKMLGVKPMVHFLVWFLDTFLALVVSSAFITIILKASQILPNSNGFIVFLYLLDFGVSVTAMSYLIATFFSHANTAALSACLLYIITFFPYMVLVAIQNQLNFSSQILICLLCPTAFSQGTYIITLFEGDGSGIQWNNMYEATGDGDNVSFAWICWMMIIDSVIYLILGWYLQNVFPGKYGTRRPWYFPFTGLYWINLCDCAKQHDRKIGEGYWAQNLNHYNQQMNVKGEPLNSANLSGKEMASPNLKIGVALRSLTKEFKHGKKVAIKDLNLDFYQGEITALLGPNGAGKTTTMSMLTGLHQPSSGAVYVNGRSMNREMTNIREELGVCLQHDVLFDCLTVREHLLLYGIIKAPQWTNKQLLQEVKMALENVGICQHQDKLVGALSGGAKRKLSIAISFLGGSSTVILDEPTSGIDPCSRRNIWDIMLKYRAGRTIIFTTHHLDEADILSDRIAILENGQLKCCGSPAYLKEQYGQGYSLSISKKPSVAGSDESCDVGLVTSLVKQHIPLAFLKEDAFGELSYGIPTTEDKTAYEKLFQTLDQDMEKLHLSSYSISDTTLEEVFMKLLQSDEKPAPYKGQDTESLKSDSIESTESDSVALAGSQRVTGMQLILKQMAALMIKRFHHTKRDWKGAIAKMLLPVLFVILAMALFSVKPLAAEYPSLRLSPDIYQDSDVTFFSSGENDFLNLTSVLLKSLKINESCIGQASNLKSSSCWWNGTSEPQNFVGQCNCNNGYQQCPTPNTTVSYYRNNEGNFLYNLTGYNLEDYLISTENTFGQKRLGGWSIGHKLPDELKGNNFTQFEINSLMKVWYNQKSFHTEPAYLNQLNNLILWANLPPGTDWTQYGITLYSHPYRGSLPDGERIMENLRQCGVAFCILLGFSVLTASIGGYIVQDRITGQKRLQHISGLGYRVYWITNFLYDMVYYMVPVVLCICVFAAFQFSAFTYNENLGATSLLLILFGFATLPWMYLLSRFFSSPDVAFITYVAINLVLGLCTILAAYLPRFLALISNQENLLNIYSVLRWVFIIFPQFCLSLGLIELSYNQLKFDLTQVFGVDSYVSPFEMEFLGWVFVAITLEGCLFFSIRLIFQGNLLHKLSCKDSLPDTTSNVEDEDVRKEYERVLNGGASNDVLQIHNLKKCYKKLNKKVNAVKGVTMGVPTGECFGLLGVNGAGKTTTFKMLTGDEGPSSGHAIIRTAAGSEQNIMNTDIDGTLIGYCPQYDALDDLLTGWEHMYYYCRIRGMPEKMIKKHIHDLAHRLHLTSHINKLVKTYSGGTKRKLSTVLALIGRPQVLLLDEPSSGMDPESKRYLWKAIMCEVEAGCAAVLTSHSMEECEALCTRLAIMVNGKFRCIGSPKHIKNRFGEVYSVKVGLSRKSDDSTQLTDLLETHFPGTILKEQHQYSLEYQVPQKKGDLAKMFQFLQNNKEELNIKHYSISQATLDQVFINFARQLDETLDQTAVENGETNLPV
ncbi:ATP-binding cassette sub-family A member 13-like [Heterodontus francisci]|uniref:ATP-binding cassette sub-family A member 13-like n=1 Tax=Heterodontus francisci TaxID=7792 RepID=UPI00355B463D